MIVVNLFGAPGAGKSTGAAYIFSKLKMAGVNAELVTEYAKDKVWEESKKTFENQAYIFGHQYFRISRCADKVDVVITDSPILLSIIYNNDPALGKAFDEMVKQVHNSYKSYNYYLERVKPYNPVGRFQDENGSNSLAKDILTLAEGYCNHLDVATGDIKGYDYIVNDILNKLENEKGA